MIRDIIKVVEIFTKVSDPPEMKEKAINKFRLRRSRPVKADV